MQRRYKESESNSIREDLAQYMSMSRCRDCSGTRLRQEARHVFIDQQNLPDLCERSIAETHQYFKSLKLDDKRQQIATKVLHEIEQRLSFLVNVGLNYLSLSRSAETLSGGEAQRIRLASQIGAAGGRDVCFR